MLRDRVKILIASPSDVGRFRNAAMEVIEVLNWDLFRDKAISVEGVRYERAATYSLGEAPQRQIDQQLLPVCDLGVGIFWWRAGTPVEDAPGGAIHELYELVGAGKPVVVGFRSVRPPKRADPEQAQALQDFRKWCDTNGLYFQFTSIDSFKFELSIQLRRAINKILHSPKEEHAPRSLTDFDLNPGLVSNYERFLPRHYVSRPKFIESVSSSLQPGKPVLCSVFGARGSGKTTAIAATLDVLTRREGFRVAAWVDFANRPSLDRVATAITAALDAPCRVETEVAGQEPRKSHPLSIVVFDNFEATLDQRSGTLAREYAQLPGRVRDILRDRKLPVAIILAAREHTDFFSEVDSEYRSATVRVPPFNGEEAASLLSEFDIVGTANEWEMFAVRSSGNPLLLRLWAAQIKDVFGGVLQIFLERPSIEFSAVHSIFEWHFSRLSDSETHILELLSVARVQLELQDVSHLTDGAMTERVTLFNLLRLHRRSLVEVHGSKFFLLSAVAEVLSQRIVNQARSELKSRKFNLLRRLPLLLPHIREDVAEAGREVFIRPIQNLFSQNEWPIQFKSIIQSIRESHLEYAGGFLVGNVLNVGLSVGLDVAGVDLTGASIRCVDFRYTTLMGVSMRGATVKDCLFDDWLAAVLCVTFDPHGRWIAAGCNDGIVKIWDATTLLPLVTYETQLDRVWSVAFSPGQDTLAIGGDGKYIELIVATTSRVVTRINVPTGRLTSLGFTADGSLLFSAHADGSIRCWAVPSGSLMGQFPAHQGGVWCIDVAKGFRGLVSGGADGNVVLWTPRRGKNDVWLQKAVIGQHQGAVRAVRFLASLNRKKLAVVSGGADQKIALWKAGTQRRAPQSVATHDGCVRAIVADATLGAVFSGGDDWTIRKWSVGTLEQELVTRRHTNQVTGLALDPDNGLIASSGDDHAVRIWRTEGLVPQRSITGRTNSIRFVTFMGSDNSIMACSPEGNWYEWSITDGSLIRILRPSYLMPRILDIRAAAVCKRTDWFASAGSLGTINLFAAGDEQHEINAHIGWVRALQFSPNGIYLASSGDDGRVNLYRLHNRREVLSLHPHQGWIRTIAFNPAGTLLASGGEDGIVRIHPLTTEDKPSVRTLSGAETPIRSLLFFDDTLICAGTDRYEIILWDTTSGSVIERISCPGPVLTLTANASAHLLAAGTQDGSVLCLSMQKSAKTTYSSQAHGSAVRSVALSESTKLLCSSDDSGNIYVHDLLTRSICQRFRVPRPYEGLDVQGSTGLTESCRLALLRLGALDY